jgi:transcriptional regulator with XRE-family HTH domain
MEATYDGTLGTAGGPAFAAALTALAQAEKLDAAGLAAKAGLPAQTVTRVLAGEERIGVPAMARLAKALRLRAVEFMQKSGLLSLEVYAMGLDPLYFLPDGPIRFDARIYMREINPRHAVPEGDMLKRNPVLKALIDDPLLDAIGKIEVELAYLLRTAVQTTNGTL